MERAGDIHEAGRPGRLALRPGRLAARGQEEEEEEDWGQEGGITPPSCTPLSLSLSHTALGQISPTALG